MGDLKDNEQAYKILIVAAVSGFLVVAIGAFGAHGLKHILSDKSLSIYQTAVQYHMFHTVALLIVGGMIFKNDLGELANRWLRRASYFFLIGLVLFCGSLYALAISGIPGLGMVTPLGGVAFLLGWFALAMAWIRK